MQGVTNEAAHCCDAEAGMPQSSAVEVGLANIMLKCNSVVVCICSSGG